MLIVVNLFECWQTAEMHCVAPGSISNARLPHQNIDRVLDTLLIYASLTEGYGWYRPPSTPTVASGGRNRSCGAAVPSPGLSAEPRDRSPRRKPDTAPMPTSLGG